MRLPTLGTILQAVLAAQIVLGIVPNQTGLDFTERGKRVSPPEKELSTPTTSSSSRRLIGSGFRRFQWVTKNLRENDKLARSSAPYYESDDADQLLTDESIEFLKNKGIVHVISLNSNAKDRRISVELEKNGIAYTPLPVPDYDTPTIEDFQRGYEAFREARGGATLVWCGYGHGRTGAMTTAFQLFSQNERPTPNRIGLTDYVRNHVETRAQVRELERLKEMVSPGGTSNELRQAFTAYGEARDAADALRQAQHSKDAAPKEEDAVFKVEEAEQEQMEAAQALNINRGVFQNIMDLVAAAKQHNKIHITHPVSSEDSDEYSDVSSEYSEYESSEASDSDDDEFEAFMEEMRRFKKKAQEAAGDEVAMADNLADSEKLVRRFGAKIEQRQSLNAELNDRTRETIDDIQKNWIMTMASTFDSIQRRLDGIKEKVESMKQELGIEANEMSRLQRQLEHMERKLGDLLAEVETPKPIDVMHRVLKWAKNTVDGMAERASRMASIIDSQPGADAEALTPVRNLVRSGRISAAKINALVVSHTVQDYFVEPWMRMKATALDKVNVAREAAVMGQAALVIQPLTEIMSDDLNIRTDALSHIEDTIRNAGSDPMEHDLQLAVYETDALWLRSKEQPKEALEKETEILKAEIEITEPPVYGLAVSALNAKRESNMAMLMTTEQEHREAHALRLWKQNHLLKLEELIYKDKIEKEEKGKKQQAAEEETRDGKPPKEAEPPLSAEVAAGAEAADNHASNQLNLAIQVGTAALNVIPSMVSPVFQLFAWAKIAIRAIQNIASALRVYLRRTPYVVAQVERAEQISERLSDGLKASKVAIPQNIEQWATTRTPKQVLDRLEAYQNVGEAPTTSVGEALRTLEEINPPAGSPGAAAASPAEAPLEKPLKKLLRKLARVEVPMESPSNEALPTALLADLRSPMPAGELAARLREATWAPRRGAAAARNFWLLLDEAQTRLAPLRRAAGARDEGGFVDRLFEEAALAARSGARGPLGRAGYGETRRGEGCKRDGITDCALVALIESEGYDDAKPDPLRALD